MTTKKRAVIAGACSVLLVGAAQVGLDANIDFAMWIVLPGAAINLLTRGVHGTWNPYVTLVPSAVVWFAVIYGFLALVAKEYPGKIETKSRRRPENNARDLT